MGVPMEHDVGMLIVSFCGTLQIKSNQIKSNQIKSLQAHLSVSGLRTAVQCSVVVLVCVVHTLAW
jgi:hypothetical protein